MNPLVEKMLLLTNEVQTLEQIFEQNCDCENEHTSPDNLYCAGQAKYLGLSCEAPMKLCDAAGQYWERIIRSKSWVCDDCGIPVEKCWTIRPI